MRVSFIIFFLIISIITGITVYGEEPENGPFGPGASGPVMPEPSTTILPEPPIIGGEYGWVYIESDPNGASVSFDGISRGNSPVTVKVLSTETPDHTISLQKPGYEPWFQKLYQNPEPDQTIPIHAHLQPIITPTPTQRPEGYLMVQTIPSGAMVSFDESYMGTSPITIKVDPSLNREHQVSVSLSGYQRWSQAVTRVPGPGETIPITVTLQPITPTPTETIIEPGYGWIYIDSNPRGGTVIFDNDDKGTTPVNVKVYSSGTPDHSISVSMTGYQRWSQTLSENPAPGETMQVYASLQAYSGYGTIAVQSNPSGAAVTLDTLYPLTTPCTYRSVTPGLHTISVTSPGYRPYSTSVQVNSAAQSSVSVTLTPVKSTGKLQALSTPSGADLSIDGIYRGQTPINIGNVDTGNHQVTLRLAGYQTWKETVLVNADQYVTINPTLTQNPPSPQAGSIQVSSTPPGANVYLNTNYQGITPSRDYLDLTDLSPGTYSVFLEKPGYINYTSTVGVQAGIPVTLNITLPADLKPAPSHGSLMIESDPSGADLLLDNLFTGITPCYLTDISTGPHTILLRMNGYQQSNQTVQVNSGATLPVKVTLTEEVTPVKPTQAPSDFIGYDPGVIGLILIGIVGIGVIIVIIVLLIRKKDQDIIPKP